MTPEPGQHRSPGCSGPQAGPGTWKGGSRRTPSPALSDATAHYGRPRLSAQTYRAQNEDAAPPGFSSRSPQSPGEGPRRSFPNARPAAVTLQPIPSGRGPATNQRPAVQARRVELRPGPRAAGRAGLFRCRPGQAFDPDSARAPARQPAAAVSAAACLRGVAPMHGQQRGPR